MSRLVHILPVMMLGFSFYLATTQHHYYSVGTMVASLFMWLLTVSIELNNKNKDR